MAKPIRLRVAQAVLVFASLFFIVTSAQAQPSSQQKSFETPEEVVTEIYNMVSFEAGTTPDWDKVKALFHDEAVIVLRASRTEMKVLSVDAFVADFVTFIQQFRADTPGFVEKVVSVKPVVFGNIAHCFVVYEASIPNRPRPPQRGVDSFQLAKLEEGWRIVSIVNEVVFPGREMPEGIMK